MNDLVNPTIERIEPPVYCTYCYASGQYSVRLATHRVDGTSVCARHLPAAIKYAREKRQQ